jgi:hypothetical protein
MFDDHCCDSFGNILWSAPALALVKRHVYVAFNGVMVDSGLRRTVQYALPLKFENSPVCHRRKTT